MFLILYFVFKYCIYLAYEVNLERVPSRHWSTFRMYILYIAAMAFDFDFELSIGTTIIRIHF
jgi:hypothetical protein